MAPWAPVFNGERLSLINIVETLDRVDVEPSQNRDFDWYHPITAGQLERISNKDSIRESVVNLWRLKTAEKYVESEDEWDKHVASWLVLYEFPRLI